MSAAWALLLCASVGLSVDTPAMRGRLALLLVDEGLDVHGDGRGAIRIERSGARYVLHLRGERIEIDGTVPSVAELELAQRIALAIRTNAPTRGPRLVYLEVRGRVPVEARARQAEAVLASGWGLAAKPERAKRGRCLVAVDGAVEVRDGVPGRACEAAARVGADAGSGSDGGSQAASDSDVRTASDSAADPRSRSSSDVGSPSGSAPDGRAAPRSGSRSDSASRSDSEVREKSGSGSGSRPDSDARETSGSGSGSGSRPDSDARAASGSDSRASSASGSGSRPPRGSASDSAPGGSGSRATSAADSRTEPPSPSSGDSAPAVRPPPTAANSPSAPGTRTAPGSEPADAVSDPDPDPEPGSAPTATRTTLPSRPASPRWSLTAFAGGTLRAHGADPALGIDASYRPSWYGLRVAALYVDGGGPPLRVYELLVVAGPTARRSLSARWSVGAALLVGARMHAYDLAPDDAGTRWDVAFDAPLDLTWSPLDPLTVALVLRPGVDSRARRHVDGAEVLWERGALRLGAGLQLGLEL